MTDRVMSEKEDHSEGFYLPSWINHLEAWVGRLQGPTIIVFYIAVWLTFTTILTLFRWLDGVYPPGTFSINDVVMSATGIFFLALIHYLDHWAIHKFIQYREDLKVTDLEFERIGYELTKLPAKKTTVASLIAFSFGLLTFLFFPQSYDFLNLNFSSLSGIWQLLNFLGSWYVFGALSYHAYRQLSLGSQIVTENVTINLLDLDPIYAFAGLTLRTALGWLIMAYAWALVTPDLMGNYVIAATILFMQVVAVLTFLLPLLRAHRRIVESKNGLLLDVRERLGASFQAGSRQGGKTADDDLDLVQNDLSTLTLMMLEERLEKTPTWPWRANMVNVLVSAIVLPNAIWVAQLLLEHSIFGN
ncbi:MAG: hypothetical protein WAM60_22050 [Candidatus Promineifilaceae bacterium]